MTIQVGDRLPAVSLKKLTPDGIKDVPITEVTKGKKVVLFAVPGAFTPTCSEKHFPGFVDQAGDITAKGDRCHRVRRGQRSVRAGGMGEGLATSTAR